jgi:hypothetical protein
MDTDCCVHFFQTQSFVSILKATLSPQQHVYCHLSFLFLLSRIENLQINHDGRGGGPSASRPRRLPPRRERTQIVVSIFPDTVFCFRFLGDKDFCFHFWTDTEFCFRLLNGHRLLCPFFSDRVLFPCFEGDVVPPTTYCHLSFLFILSRRQNPQTNHDGGGGGPSASRSRSTPPSSL